MGKIVLISLMCILLALAIILTYYWGYHQGRHDLAEEIDDAIRELNRRDKNRHVS